METKIDMYKYENDFLSREYKLICGVDEAGRGPLAGPCVAAAVILDENIKIDGLNDSKKLSEKKRELLYDEIIKKAKYYHVAFTTKDEIEDINILQATFLAMRRAVKGLGVKPDIVMIDGNANPNIEEVETITIVKGDANSATIAAASILAKVTRDRYMVELAKEYPQYMFEKHKGYGTKLHRELILKYGPCKEHRASFLRKILANGKA